MPSTDENPLTTKKKLLNKRSEAARVALEEQVLDWRSNTAQTGKQALLIGAGAVTSFVLVRAFIRAGNKRVKVPAVRTSENGHAAPHGQSLMMAPAVRPEPLIVSLIKQQIALFLIGFAKQKIQEAVDHYRRTDKAPVKQNEPDPTTPIRIE